MKWHGNGYNDGKIKSNSYFLHVFIILTQYYLYSEF